MSASNLLILTLNYLSQLCNAEYMMHFTLKLQNIDSGILIYFIE